VEEWSREWMESGMDGSGLGVGGCEYAGNKLQKVNNVERNALRMARYMFYYLFCISTTMLD
jgi:hypothetical protein